MKYGTCLHHCICCVQLDGGDMYPLLDDSEGSVGTEGMNVNGKCVKYDEIY